jgi:selenocysteine-specific elongation factor
MIVATAGHVDHGKTLLVKALTGIDADRLPEEKQRGMTIDLGFAYLPVESEPLGFIDVPGHERFIHNMLCGVVGIDAVLFIVAADDGPRPQSTEHLAILHLLDVSRGAIALTKVDRVAPARVHEVQTEIALLLAGTRLEGAPVFPVSAVTGEGIGALKDYLLHAARDCPLRPCAGNFRLAIDRCFTLTGAGLIVTGTVFSGSVAVGDHVRVLQAGVSARIRSIHAQNRPSGFGRAGQRCALNLAGAGLKHELINRGDWIVTGDVPEPVSKLDAQLRILASEQQPLAHWTSVHVHLAASGMTGRTAILEGTNVKPGGSALVQLLLDRPIGALHGDRFIIRDQSAQRTIGGGEVVDIFPPVRGRAKPERLAYLAAMQSNDHAGALRSLLDISPSGMNLSKFAANRNLTAKEGAQLLAALPTKVVVTADGKIGFSQAQWGTLEATMLEKLAVFHRREPNVIALSEERIRGEIGMRLPREVVASIAAELAGEGSIVRDPSGVRLPAHMPVLAAQDAALWKKVAPLLDQNPLRPPVVHEIAAAIHEDPKKTEAFLVRASRLGLVVKMAHNRFFLPAALHKLRSIAAGVAAARPDHAITAAVFRDRTGIGRTLAIEILEYFDRIKFTRRVGDAHQIVRPTADAFGHEPL